MNELLVIVPSRGRPANVDRLVAAIRATAITDPTIVIGLDADDESQYPKLPGVSYAVAPERTRFVSMVNNLAAILWQSAPFIAVLGDDVVPETPGWDRQLIDAIAPLPFGIAYGHDGNWQHGELPTHVVVSSSMFQALGWLCWPGLTHLYADNVWKALGDELGVLRWLPDVSMQHLHPMVGARAPMDVVYAEANDRRLYEQDGAAFRAWQAGALFTDACARLRALGPRI